MAEGLRFRKSLGAGIAIGVLAIGFIATSPGWTQEVKTLRGRFGVEETAPPPDVVRQQMPGTGMFDRAYRQQPPLIPHRVDTYQVTKDFNQCMTCHDWPANIKAGALKVPETHYHDREGNRLDKIAGSRFFCTQCHVPQADAKPLVTNTFQNATEVK